jgi:hypothetical protein
MGGIPRDGIGAHRMRRTGTSPYVDAGQNFHVTAGRCATKDVVLAAFTRGGDLVGVRHLVPGPGLRWSVRRYNKPFVLLSQVLQVC